MTIVLGDNQYGKAETHVVRVSRDGATHDIKDVNVSVALAGDFDASHTEGDNRNVVPTDTQKNTVFAFAKDSVGEIEEFGLRLARHFAGDFAAVKRARVSIEEYAWERINAGGRPHSHAFVRAGAEKRLTMVTCTKEGAWVVSGLSDLVLLKSAGSEFWGFPKDRYTTLEETRDRILATAVEARWRYEGLDVDWGTAFTQTRAAMIEAFAVKHSLALQQTLYAMGEAALKARPEIAEIRMTMPNKHHFLVDLSPFGLGNENEVFHAADRPYGLIEGTVTRDDAPEPGLAW
ncbi:MAG: urate oxidase [Actinobacteria bacterium 13_1_20CM_2_65_11]|nr:MAG: urate oxidase [Actinobacteria bacterium 13_1_20CM_2_65_11]